VYPISTTFANLTENCVPSATFCIIKSVHLCVFRCFVNITKLLCRLQCWYHMSTGSRFQGVF